MNFVEIVTIGDYLLVGVKQSYAFLGLVLGLALGLVSMWLANRPQPRPHRASWAGAEDDRRFTARRRGRRRV